MSATLWHVARHDAATGMIGQNFRNAVVERNHFHG